MTGLVNSISEHIDSFGVTLSGDTIDANKATAGPAGSSGTPGQGIGGGLNIVVGAVVKADAHTAIFANLGSTSNNDVFGNLLRF